MIFADEKGLYGRLTFGGHPKRVIIIFSPVGSRTKIGRVRRHFGTTKRAFFVAGAGHNHWDWAVSLNLAAAITAYAFNETHH